MATGAGNIMKVLLRYSGDCFLRWNYGGGSIVSAVPVKAKVFLTLHTPPPAGRYGAGGSRRGERAGSRHVRAGAVASAKDLRVGGVSRAQSREGTKDEDAWRIRRLEIAVMDIQNRLGALDGDLKGVNGQLSLVREAVGNLHVTTGAIAADVTRVGNDLSSAKEELKNEAKGAQEGSNCEQGGLKSEAAANKEELKSEATANKVELKSEATANKVELKSGISNVRDELKSAKEELKKEATANKVELKKEATANKEELKKEATSHSTSSSKLNKEDIKSDVRDDLSSVDAELRDEIQRFKGAIWTLALVCVAAVATALLGADQAAAALNGALGGGK
jgi:chromosome segregation ATPase